jgi:hypothetical protein
MQIQELLLMASAIAEQLATNYSNEFSSSKAYGWG